MLSVGGILNIVDGRWDLEHCCGLWAVRAWWAVIIDGVGVNGVNDVGDVTDIIVVIVEVRPAGQGDCARKHPVPELHGRQTVLNFTDGRQFLNSVDGVLGPVRGTGD